MTTDAFFVIRLILINIYIYILVSWIDEKVRSVSHIRKNEPSTDERRSSFSCTLPTT